MDLINIYRPYFTQQPHSAYVLGHSASLSKFKNTEPILCILSDCKRLKWENDRAVTSTRGFEYMLINAYWVLKEMKKNTTHFLKKWKLKHIGTSITETTLCYVRITWEISQENTENASVPTTSIYTLKIIKIFPAKTNIGPTDFTSQFYKAFREELSPILFKVL